LIIIPIGHDKLTPVALLKTGRIFLKNIGNDTLGKGALEFLINSYPDYSGINEAKTLLMESENNLKEVKWLEQKQRVS